jgi:hypothetical protein
MLRYSIIILSVLFCALLLVAVQVDLGEDTGEKSDLVKNEDITEYEVGLKNSVIPPSKDPIFESVSLWTFPSSLPASTPTIRDDAPGKQLVHFNRELLLGLSAGQIAIMAIPHVSDPMEVKINSVEQLKSGNVSIRGKVNGNPLLDFVMTLGERSTFATIGTEEGVFNLRGNLEVAWIAPARAFNHHVDPNVLDYRIPSNEPFASDAAADADQGSL